MPDTGFKAPTVSVSGNFTNPDNVFASDNTRAVATSTQLEVYSTFGFSIPASANIVGIEVSGEAQGTGAAGTVGIELSWDQGSTYTTAKTNSFADGTDETKTYGGQSDLWGRGWSTSQFSDTNFRLRATDSGASPIAVDFISAKVYYLLPVVTFEDTQYNFFARKTVNNGVRGNINELKRNFFSSVTGNTTGSLEELEMLWLRTLTGVTGTERGDRWREAVIGAGLTPGNSVNDNQSIYYNTQ